MTETAGAVSAALRASPLEWNAKELHRTCQGRAQEGEVFESCRVVALTRIRRVLTNAEKGKGFLELQG